MRNSYNRSKTKRKKKEEKFKPENFTKKRTRLNTKRSCLKCGKIFASKGFHNRICIKCDLINERQGKANYNCFSLIFPEVTDYTETLMGAQ